MQDDANDQVPLWKVFFGGEKSKTTSPDTKTKTPTKTTTRTTTTTSTTTTTTTKATTTSTSIKPAKPLMKASDDGSINSGGCQDSMTNKLQDFSMRSSGISGCDSENVHSLPHRIVMKPTRRKLHEFHETAY